MLMISNEMEKIVERFDGQMAISIATIDGEVLYERNFQTVMKIASVGKLFILGTLLEKCEQDPIHFALSHTLPVKNEDKVEGSGVIQYLDENSYTVKDLATLMVIVSDNTATNKILAYLGGANEVKKHLAKYGISESGVNRRIAMTEEDMKIGCFAQAKTEDLIRYILLMEQGKVLGKEYLRIFDEILTKQQYKDMFLRRICEQDGVVCGSKTGFDEDQRADAGWIRVMGQTIVYALIAGGGSDTRYTADNEAAVCMAEIGEVFYKSMAGHIKTLSE